MKIAAASWIKLARLAAAAWALWLVSGSAWAFVLPEDPNVGAGSEWRYDSNLGATVVRMLEREDLGDGYQRYAWEMRVAGLRYTEDLELTPDQLSVSERELAGFLLSERFLFAAPELVMELPLEVGNAWSWTGEVRLGTRTETAHARGEVVGIEEVTVPAGTFKTYWIRIERTDGFGTQQSIDLWFDPLVGPIRAVGDLRWRGLIGAIQSLIGFTRFEVDLVEFSLAPPS